MGLAILAILVIVVGAALRVLAPNFGAQKGSLRLFSYVVMLFGVGLASRPPLALMLLMD